MNQNPSFGIIVKERRKELGLGIPEKIIIPKSRRNDCLLSNHRVYGNAAVVFTA